MTPCSNDVNAPGCRFQRFARCIMYCICIYILSRIVVYTNQPLCLCALWYFVAQRRLGSDLAAWIRISHFHAWRIIKQTYQVSLISRETRTPAFWSHLPLTRRITKISRISSTKFGQLILSKMVKIVATRCHNLMLKCPKFDFRWGSTPDPAEEAQVTVLSQTS